MSSLPETALAAPPHGEAELPPAMTEVELLPAWYPTLVRRRRWLVGQLWVTGVLVVVLITILILRRENVAATHVELASVEEQRRQVDSTLAELQTHQDRLIRLAELARLVSQAGLPLEISRVLAEVERLLPAEVALTDIEAVTEEAARRGGDPGGPASRVMRFTVRGIAPEGFSATERLGGSELWRSARLVRAQPMTVYGRAVVGFELSFVVDLSTADDAFSQTAGGNR